MKGIFLGRVLLILPVFFLHGCGGGSDATTPSNVSIGNSTTELEGVWKKFCGRADLTDPNSHFDIVTVTFTNNEFFSDIENYDDAACTVPFSYAPNPTASGTFVIGATVTLSDGTQAKELDSHIDTYNGAPFQIDDYGVYRIETNIAYFEVDSDILDGTTPELRPDALDYNREFVRQ